MRSKTARRYQGFTIVELIIVIVVIAILAVVTIVGYNGITHQALQSSLKSNLEQTAKLVANYKTISGVYPASLSVLNDGQGPKLGDGMNFAYTQEGGGYCLTIGSVDTSKTYHICGNSGSIQDGTYASHAELIAGYPTRGGFSDITQSYGVEGTLRADIGAVPVGSWMVVVLSYNNSIDPVPPEGWATLVQRKTTGTMQTSIYAKTKQLNDTADQDFTTGGSRQYTNGAVLWGENAAAVSSWVLGAFGDRANNATPATVVAPATTVSSMRSLVLSIATERTVAAEADYVSLVGASPWVWVPQVDGNKMQTIVVGYSLQATPGMSQPMTVTYPNTQALNGTGVQLIIPPAN